MCDDNKEISTYTSFLGHEELFGSKYNPKKSTPCSTPLSSVKRISCQWDEMSFKKNYNYFKSHTSETTLSSPGKRKRDLDNNRPKSVALENMIDTKKSPKTHPRASPRSFTTDLVKEEDNKILDLFTKKKFMVIRYDKYFRGLSNIKNLQNPKWINKNSNRLKFINNDKLSKEIKSEMIELVTDFIIKEPIYDYKINLKNYFKNNYDIFDILHYKVHKCKKEDKCKSEKTECLCRYYHEYEDNNKMDDINCLMYIMFYDNFRKKNCDKKECKKKNCYFYHENYNPKRSYINNKIIELLKYIYDKYTGENKYTNLIKLIKEKLIHQKDYNYIMENIGEEKKLFFDYPGLERKSPNRIKREYFKIKPPTRQRTDSGSAPTSPSRKNFKNPSISRIIKPRALSFDKKKEKKRTWGNSMLKKNFFKTMTKEDLSLYKNFGPPQRNATEYANDKLMISRNDDINIKDNKEIKIFEIFDDDDNDNKNNKDYEGSAEGSVVGSDEGSYEVSNYNSDDYYSDIYNYNSSIEDDYDSNDEKDLLFTFNKEYCFPIHKDFDKKIYSFKTDSSLFSNDCNPFVHPSEIET